MKYCVGVDVGGTTVKLGIFEAEGRLLEKWEIKTRKGEDGRQFIADTAASIREHLLQHGIAESDVIGAGMGVPGPVVANGYVELCPNLGLHKCYPAKELSEALGGMKVEIGNDANVAALGELWQGAGKGHHSICMVTLGTGVGGGLVNEGRMISGVHGAGGEIGHMHVVDDEPEACNCGGHGCLEQYASATGIARVARRKLAETPKPSAMRAFGEHISAKNVCDCAKEGDETALLAIRFSMQKLALILSHVALGTDPKLFVIGGGVSKAGDFLTDMIQTYLRELTPLIKDDSKNVVLAELGNDAGIYGAAKLALEE
ncbi:MAG: ROK family glucokinase [Eubacteriales bacterium]|nr:ROK family glucokinase [Eubacteriales bacterium]